ncbi:MAG: carboxypeptidase regulatory-like domain-containing protein, partial [Nitrospiria bacterium]
MLLSADAVAQSPLPSPEELSHCTLEEALVHFNDATGLDLIWDPPLLVGKSTKTVKPEGETPEHYLRAMLQGTGLYYSRQSSGTYAIHQIDRTSARRGSLGGFVIDRDTGDPLSYVHIRLTETAGTVTNATGVFSIPSVPPDLYVLEISHTGYWTIHDTVQVWPGEHSELFLELPSRTYQFTDPLVVYGPPDRAISLPPPLEQLSAVSSLS